MGTPQNNPEGYKKSSPVHAAKNLHGKLLLIHGAIDDNVHMQNTMQFVYELQKAGKQFELMLYPKSRHGVTDPLLLKHMRQMMTGLYRGEPLDHGLHGSEIDSDSSLIQSWKILSILFRLGTGLAVTPDGGSPMSTVLASITQEPEPSCLSSATQSSSIHRRRSSVRSRQIFKMR